MASTQDLGRAILMKRMISSLQQCGYRVELAADYGGYIVAGLGEDPPVYLLDADVIEKCRVESPGDVRGFLDRVTRHVQSQLGSQASVRSSYPPIRERAIEQAQAPGATPEQEGGGAGEDAAQAGQGGGPIDEKQAIEGESTEELSLEDFK